MTPASGRSMLLTYNFAPMGGGIARWMGELALRYPPGTLVISTGAMSGSRESDATFPNPVARIAHPAAKLRTLLGMGLWARRAATLARQHEVRFVWCGQIRPAAFPARWMAKRLGIPYGIVMHGGDVLALRRKYSRSPFTRAIATSLLRAASVLVANSRWTRDMCLQMLGELGIESPDGFVRVVPLGTDPTHFRPGLPTAHVRSRYALPEGRWLLTVARLVPHKGVDTGLRAFATLAADYPDLHYAVVGQGSHLATLEGLASELGVRERVRFLTDVTDADLPAVYCLADIYVGSSRHEGVDIEGFGITLSEASAAGLPIVAGRNGGMPDAVREGETGILVDSSNPDEIASGVRELLDNPDQARLMGETGRSEVERYFNWNRVVNDMRAIAHDLAPGSASLRWTPTVQRSIAE